MELVDLLILTEDAIGEQRCPPQTRLENTKNDTGPSVGGGVKCFDIRLIRSLIKRENLIFFFS